ncbi:MAG: hypothetical protein ACYSVY_13405 [Planctomycetota bacterium]
MAPLETVREVVIVAEWASGKSNLVMELLLTRRVFDGPALEPLMLSPRITAATLRNSLRCASGCPLGAPRTQTKEAVMRGLDRFLAFPFPDDHPLATATFELMINAGATEIVADEMNPHPDDLYHRIRHLRRAVKYVGYQAPRERNLTGAQAQTLVVMLKLVEATLTKIEIDHLHQLNHIHQQASWDLLARQVANARSEIEQLISELAGPDDDPDPDAPERILKEILEDIDSVCDEWRQQAHAQGYRFTVRELLKLVEHAVEELGLQGSLAESASFLIELSAALFPRLEIARDALEGLSKAREPASSWEVLVVRSHLGFWEQPSLVRRRARLFFEEWRLPVTVLKLPPADQWLAIDDVVGTMREQLSRDARSRRLHRRRMLANRRKRTGRGFWCPDDWRAWLWPSKAREVPRQTASRVNRLSFETLTMRVASSLPLDEAEMLEVVAARVEKLTIPDAVVLWSGFAERRLLAYFRRLLLQVGLDVARRKRAAATIELRTLWACEHRLPADPNSDGGLRSGVFRDQADAYTTSSLMPSSMGKLRTGLRATRFAEKAGLVRHGRLQECHGSDGYEYDERGRLTQICLDDEPVSHEFSLPESMMLKFEIREVAQHVQADSN